MIVINNDYKNVSASLARRHLLHFVKYMWQNPSEPFVVGYHTRKICERFDRAINDLKNGKSTFLLLMVPFRHGKSDLSSRYMPAKFRAEFPESDFIGVSYSQSLMRKFSRYCRAIIKDPKIRDIYHNCIISKTVANVDDWGLEGRTGLSQWRGIGGTITGNGGRLINVDDFFASRAQAESIVYRDRVYRAIKDEIITRRPSPSIVALTATPWHIDDPFGRIYKEMESNPKFPRFETLRFPAMSPDYPTGYLFPEKYPEEWYDSMFAALGKYSSAGLLQCEPMAMSGNYLKGANRKIVNRCPNDIQYVRAWDLASTAKQKLSDDPDYTVGVKMGIQWKQTAIADIRIPILWIDDIVYGQWNGKDRDDVILSTTIKDGSSVSCVGIEAFGQYADAYREIKEILHGVVSVSKCNLPGDKVSKAACLIAPFEAGNVFFKKADWNSFAESQISKFPSDKHDDIVDAIACAYDLCKRIQGITSQNVNFL